MIHGHDPHGSTIADTMGRRPVVKYENGEFFFAHKDNRVEFAVPIPPAARPLYKIVYGNLKRCGQL